MVCFVEAMLHNNETVHLSTQMTLLAVIFHIAKNKGIV